MTLTYTYVYVSSLIKHEYHSSVLLLLSKWHFITIFRQSLSTDRWLDGICVIYVNKDLYVTKHVIEKVGNGNAHNSIRALVHL